MAKKTKRSKCYIPAVNKALLTAAKVIGEHGCQGVGDDALAGEIAEHLIDLADFYRQAGDCADLRDYLTQVLAR